MVLFENKDKYLKTSLYIGGYVLLLKAIEQDMPKYIHVYKNTKGYNHVRNMTDSIRGDYTLQKEESE